MNIASMIGYTLLKRDVTKSDIIKICDGGK